jgi:hypothetical protein
MPHGEMGRLSHLPLAVLIPTCDHDPTGGRQMHAMSARLLVAARREELRQQVPPGQQMHRRKVRFV